MDNLPDVVPARMINEVLYCERLMYLEWVQGEFRDNAYTLDGRSVHRRVDRGSGRLGPPTEGAQADVAGDNDGEPRPEVAYAYAALCYLCFGGIVRALIIFFTQAATRPLRLSRSASVTTRS